MKPGTLVQFTSTAQRLFRPRLPVEQREVGVVMETIGPIVVFYWQKDRKQKQVEFHESHLEAVAAQAQGAGQ